MKYRITTASFPCIGANNSLEHLAKYGQFEAARYCGAIPNTEFTVELDTANGPGKDIFDGYIAMRAEQKRRTQPLAINDWTRVRLKEDASEENQFKEAFEMFSRYMAGEGQDTFKLVTKIEAVTDVQSKKTEAKA